MGGGPLLNAGVGVGAPPPSGERFVAIAVGARHFCGLREDGSTRCWGDNAEGQAAPPEGERFTAVSAGAAHTCGLRGDGSAVCWGNNEHGQASPPEGDQPPPAARVPR